MRRGRQKCAAGAQGKSRRGHGRRPRFGRGRVDRATAPKRLATVGRPPGPLLSVHWDPRTTGWSEERGADGAEPQQRAGGGGFGERKIFGGGRNSGRVRRAWISI